MTQIQTESNKNTWWTLRSVEVSMDEQAYRNAVNHIKQLDKRFKVNKAAGWVYAFTNPSFKSRMYKIGITSRDPNMRLQELSKETGVPADYEMVYFVHVQDRIQAENWVHKRLVEFRVRTNKEFFSAPLSLIVSVFQNVAEKYPIYYAPKRRGFGSLPQAFRRARIKCKKCETIVATMIELVKCALIGDRECQTKAQILSEL